jgi:uncharacterized protein YceK
LDWHFSELGLQSLVQRNKLLLRRKEMKKLFVVLVVLTLVSGCAGFGKWTPGAQKVVDFVCKPTPEQQLEAAKWLVALDVIQGTVAAAFPPLAIVQASTAMTVLKNGGCFLLSQVEAALILIADMQTKQAQVLQLKAIPTGVQQFPALWDVVNKSKK